MNKKLSIEEKKFAEYVVAKLGTFVKEAKQEGDVLMLNDKQIKQILLLTFQILGKKEVMSYRLLSTNLRYKKQ